MPWWLFIPGKLSSCVGQSRSAVRCSVWKCMFYQFYYLHSKLWFVEHTFSFLFKFDWIKNIILLCMDTVQIFWPMEIQDKVWGEEFMLDWPGRYLVIDGNHVLIMSKCVVTTQVQDKTTLYGHIKGFLPACVDNKQTK